MPDIDQLLADQDFLNLPEEEQNNFIDEMRQKDFGNIPKTENIFSKALKHTTPSMTSGLGMANPLAPMMTMRGLNEQSIDRNVKNPILNFGAKMVSDPFTYGGGFSVGRKVGGVAENLRHPSRVFGKKMAEAQAKSPSSRLNFFDIINQSPEDAITKKALDKSGVFERFGGSRTTPEATIQENMANLTLEEGQDFQNMIKAGMRQSLKEGTSVKSTEIALKRLLGKMAKEENKVFPSMRKAKSSYGIAKNMNKFGKGVLKRAGWAAQWAPVAAAAGFLGKSFLGNSHPHQ